VVTGYLPDPEFDAERVRKDASDWLVVLRSSARSPEMEAEFRDWLQADPTHGEAFFGVTRTWELLGAAGEELRTAQRGQRMRRRVLASAVAACVVAAVGVGAWLAVTPVQTFETRHGEQRTVRLSDGSRLALNTDTKVVVRFLPHRRSLRLDRGEAAFDVAHDASRPFVVTAGRESVTAVGTSFTVRMLSGPDLSVTLAEGRLKLTPAVAAEAASAPPVLMHAGQRWTPARGVSTLEQGDLDEASAWRRGEVVFNDISLAEAVKEMNRYSAARIFLDVSRAEEFKISGIFRLDDGAAFAKTLAGLYGLTVEERDSAIHIVGEPRPQINFEGQVQKPA
jgi:transmembrane sensor